VSDTSIGAVSRLTGGKKEVIRLMADAGEAAALVSSTACIRAPVPEVLKRLPLGRP